MIALRRLVVAVSRFIDEKRLPHLLFYGPPGTGKTSTILACARRLYGSNMQSMVLEVCPAAPALGGMPAVALVLRLLLALVSTSWRGCSSTRRTTAASTSCVSRSKSLPARGPSLGESPEPALSRPARGSQAPCEVMCGARNSSGYKLIILDEADAMTGAAQAALRRGARLTAAFATETGLLTRAAALQYTLHARAVIEKYTKNARFCLICNYVSKIIPALQSRCTRFRFSPLEPDQIRLRLQTVLEAERCDSRAV